MAWRLSSSLPFRDRNLIRNERQGPFCEHEGQKEVDEISPCRVANFRDGMIKAINERTRFFHPCIDTKDGKLRARVGENVTVYKDLDSRKINYFPLFF